jgi:hypothetical protein
MCGKSIGLVPRCMLERSAEFPTNPTRLDPYNAIAVAIKRIKLENEGWERDTSVVPPTQP